jgi:alkylation response protein AidB-like acyl-CoA dehydrogenase
MDLRFSAEHDAFRAEAREWLVSQLEGEFAGVRGRGGPGDEHSLFEERHAWERALGAARWTCLSWPREYGGRDASLLEQVIFYEEYARAGGPGRVGLVGEGLVFSFNEQRVSVLHEMVRSFEPLVMGLDPQLGGSFAARA